MFHLKTAQNLIHWVQFCGTGWWWSWYIITSQVVCWQGIAGMCPHQSKYENPPAKSWIGFIITWLIQFHLWPLEGGGGRTTTLLGAWGFLCQAIWDANFWCPPPPPPLVAEWCIMRKGRNKKPTAALIQLPSSILCFCCVQHGTIPICFAWACHADFLPIIPSSPGFPFRFGLDKEVFRRLYPSLLQIFVLH